MIALSPIQVQTELLDSPALLARAQAGDGESFWALCNPLQQRLARQALALCRDEAMAQDLAQEAFIAAWKSIQRYNGQCQFSTWLCSILLHRYKSALRRSRWRKLISYVAVGEDRSLSTIEEHAATPDRAAELSERSQEILLTLQRLPDKHREVIFLRFYADESLEGIAAALGCSLGTVKSRLFNALENLRRMPIFKKEFR